MNPDDPRLSAHLFDELNESDREAVATALAEDPELREEAAHLQATAATLRAATATDDPAPALDLGRRNRIQRAVARRRHRERRPPVSGLTILAAAALLLLVVGMLLSSVGMIKESASSTKAATGLRMEMLAQDLADGERYADLPPTGWVRVADDPQRPSTFAVDVDTASYSNLRRFLELGRLPPPRAIRIEELINAFDYSDAPPTDDAAFAVHHEFTACPWAPAHRLLRIGLKGREVSAAARPPANLVFLLDVSGSMDQPRKLPLLKEAFDTLLTGLDARDRVAIAVYAGASGLALPSTRCDATGKVRIRAALDRLQAGGSTNGGAGIELAYRIAREQRIAGGVNRVILATDGDFNVGISDREALVDLVRARADAGIHLTVLGFGTGNLRDDLMEAISNRGDGTYHSIDGPREAERIFGRGLTGTLTTIAEDAKVQCFFNPAHVAAWRLLGYENRLLDAVDFNDDRADGGEIGAGHSVIALYELVPAGTAVPGGVDANPFVDRSTSEAPPPGDPSAAAVRLRLRHQPPGGGASLLQEFDLTDHGRSFAQAEHDTRWAAAVAAAGMRLRHSPHAGDIAWSRIQAIARDAIGPDPHGQRREFLHLVEIAQGLAED